MAVQSVLAFRPFIYIALALALVASAVSPSLAQNAAGPAGVIEGTVSTQNGSVKLPGVVVSILGASGEEASQQVSDGEGHFSIGDLPPARYRVRAALDGFQTTEGDAVVQPGGTVQLTLDLPIALTEEVDVVAKSPIAETQTLATTEAIASTEAQLISPGQGVQGALRLVTGVILVPGGESIDGGRPYQAGVQLGPATLVDPVTNLARLSLPADGIDSVSVLANPYEVEFGRFSSGLVVIETKKAGDQWKVAVDNLEPALRLKRFTLLNVTGITAWQPSLAIGGPLVKDRVYLEQTAQYRYLTTDIPSRPQDELITKQSFSSFTRVDATLSPRHSLAIAGGFVPTTTDQATLGTFVPPGATVDTTDSVGHAMITERAIVGKATTVETTFEFHRYQTDVNPQGPESMELLPETTLGNFFNVQHRNSAAYQWIETATHSTRGFGGLHVFKVGADLLHSDYDGSSDSRSVLIERSDGTLARRLDFDRPSIEAVDGTDIALYAQDRLQPSARFYIEFGGRFDHDGITERSSGTPRVGAAWRLNDSGSASLHGGYGLFYERTPSIAAAFQQFEEPTETRFALDGTPVGPPVLFQHLTAPNLQTARSSTWDVAYDHHVNRILTIHAGLLDREGSHQLIVEPAQTPEGSAYVMSSSGRSHYVQEEVSVHLGHEARSDLNASFVHSTAREDLNTLLSFFDVVLQPVIGANAYAPAMADAPNRFLMRGRLMPTSRWLFLATVDWRSGLPYSIVDDELEFVGPRNVYRFPTYFRLDAAFERRLNVAKFRPWLGLGVSNALNSFLPSDVQANISSPAFGSFYNSVYREYRLRIRFEK